MSNEKSNAESTENLNNDIILIDDNPEQFDFSKTGAIPKTKSANLSSASASTSCSSLSSYMSQNSKKSKQNREQESVKCPLCFKQIETNLEAHFESEHKELECPFCALLFDNNTLLNEHLDNVHNEDIGFGSVGSMESMETDRGSKKSNFKCPICNIEIKDELWLEIHVDSHFNQNTNKQEYADNNYNSIYVNRSNQSENSSQNLGSVNLNDEIIAGAAATHSAKTRALSNSSLAANVDENFEIDQIITLSDCNMIDADAKPLTSSMFNLTTSSVDKDYEIALLLDKEEKERFRKVKSESFASTSSKLNDPNEQLLERQRNEALKFRLSKEDQEYALNLSAQDYQSDSEYAAELEHEWLKQRFGMNNTKASAKALANLERAFKNNKIDIVTYHYEKDQIENRISSVFDDATTCSKNLIELIQTIPLAKSINNRMLCTRCNHYASGFIDSGYGCGYRNTQMLLSSIREDPLLKDIIFNNSYNSNLYYQTDNKSMPSISKIQQLIEQAWANGFDLMGKTQLGGVLHNTAKWIGASDVAAMFTYLKIRVELVDLQVKQTSEKNIGAVLFEYVRNYFEEESRSGRHVHPIYLQHEGHSRTIIGVETGKNENLLIFDPATRKTQIENNITNKTKLIGIFRRNSLVFNKKRNISCSLFEAPLTQLRNIM